MARQIIILNNQINSNNLMNVNYVYWLTCPVGLIRSNATGTTVVPGAGTAEIAAIQSGSVIEQVLNASLPTNWSNAVLGSYFVERYNIQQNYLTGVGTIKNYATTYYDGTAWQNVPA